MVKQVFKKGLSALPIMISLSMRMLSNQGLGGALGFMQGVNLLGDSGKQLVMQIEKYFNEGDSQSLSCCFSGDSFIEAPYGRAQVSASDFLKTLSGKVKFS